MKKFLAILLLISCVCVICSCATVDKVKDKITGKEDDDVNDITKFETAVANNNASSVIINVSKTTVLGELKSKYEIFFAEDESATINYYIEKFNDIDGTDDVINVIEGTVYRDKDGNYSEDVDIDFTAISAAAAINLAPVKASAVKNAAGDVVTFTVPTQNSSDVYGSKLPHDSTLKITLRKDAVIGMEIAWSKGKISYTYN